MPRAFFTNTATVSIGGKEPGQVFQIEVDGDGIPVETYWRKRLNERAIAPRVKAQSASPSTPFPAASPASDVEAPRKATTKKGA